MKLYCVIPFYNEASYLADCLHSLAKQTDDDFTLVLVDNASTDESPRIAQQLVDELFAGRGVVIHESTKGTGSAADTGFRYAIKQGATHIARTDADCVAKQDWIASIKAAFANTTELVLGYPSYRTDRPRVQLKDYMLFPLAVWLSDIHGLLFWRGPQYKTAYRIGAGNNMAITAELYEATGGFPRKPLEEQDDDVVLFDAARRLTPKVRRYRSVRSYASLRRPHKYGYVRAMLYYWDRKYQPKEVDVR